MQYFDHVEVKNAKWAANLIASLPKITGLSTRLVHYLAMKHKKPDGTVYANTLSDYEFLRKACEHAQRMGLIPYQTFHDGNDLSISQNLFSPGRASRHRQWPGLFKQMFDRLCISYVRCIAAKLSPVHIEIWLENSTAISIISPLAGKYNVNLIASHCTIPTAVIFQFIRRTCRASVPIRIFHLSDFDPENVNLPAQTQARVNTLLEHFRLENKYDLKIRHLMLSRRQCIDFNLPGKPCDASFSKPKVELNAMEALYPGYINETLEQNLKRYIDLSAVRKTMSKTQAELKQILPSISQIIDSGGPSPR
jgi:hypothetical protein